MSYRIAPPLVAALATVTALTAPACIPMQPGANGPAYAPPDPAQQRAAYAQSMGYPTRKSPEQLERTIDEQTKKFKKTGRRGETRLEAPQPFTFDGVNGTCYTVVMHLGEGASWGLGAEAGLKFEFRRPDTTGSGGPGVVGPGAVASVGCATATGPITLSMAPLIGQDPIGVGPLTLELYSHVLTRAEQQQLEADQQRQIAEQREQAARERERELDRREQAADRREHQADRRDHDRDDRGGASSSSPVSVTIRSSCSRTVPVFYGDKPKYGSGTTSSISSNSVSSHSFRVGDMMWVLDDNGDGAGSITISQNMREIEIGAGCSGLSAR